MGPSHRALHPKTRQLAQSSGNRTQSVRAAMSGQTADSRSEKVVAPNQGLEPSGQPEADEDPLAVHAQESPRDIQVQTAPPPPLTATALEHSPPESRVAHRWTALKKPAQEAKTIRRRLTSEKSAAIQGNGPISPELNPCRNISQKLLSRSKT